MQKTALTLLGVIISLYFAGTSKARMGMWKSPRTSANWPIYSYSDMLMWEIISDINYHQTMFIREKKGLLGELGNEEWMGFE